ncbi:MAG: hypothetical protein R3C16_02645 [Hyphomonadaceae bacterium]
MLCITKSSFHGEIMHARSILTALAAALALAAFTAAPAHVQPSEGASQVNFRGPDLAAQRAAIDRLGRGRWRMEWRGPGALPRAHRYQTERSSAILRLLLVIHGMGYDTPDHSGEPIFPRRGGDFA